MSWIPRNFQFFNLNCHFEGKNHENHNKDEFSDFYELTLFMIGKIFHKKAFRNGYSKKNRENHKKGEFRDMSKIFEL